MFVLRSLPKRILPGAVFPGVVLGEQQLIQN